MNQFQVRVLDKSHFGSVLIGACKFTISTLLEGKKIDELIPISLDVMNADNKITGSIILYLRIIDIIRSTPQERVEFTDQEISIYGRNTFPNNLIPRKINGNNINSLNSLSPHPSGKLCISKIKCSDIKSIEITYGDVNDFYLIIKMGKQNITTEVLQDSGSVVIFDEINFHVDLTDKDFINTSELIVELWNQNIVLQDNMIGTVEISVDYLLSVGKRINDSSIGTFDLIDAKGNVSGHLSLYVLLLKTIEDIKHVKVINNRVPIDCKLGCISTLDIQFSNIGKVLKGMNTLSACIYIADTKYHPKKLIDQSTLSASFDINMLDFHVIDESLNISEFSIHLCSSNVTVLKTTAISIVNLLDDKEVIKENGLIDKSFQLKNIYGEYIGAVTLHYRLIIDILSKSLLNTIIDYLSSDYTNEYIIVNILNILKILCQHSGNVIKLLENKFQKFLLDIIQRGELLAGNLAMNNLIFLLQKLFNDKIEGNGRLKHEILENIYNEVTSNGDILN